MPLDPILVPSRGSRPKTLTLRSTIFPVTSVRWPLPSLDNEGSSAAAPAWNAQTSFGVSSPEGLIIVPLGRHHYEERRV
jgi:hypothetical protein